MLNELGFLVACWAGCGRDLVGMGRLCSGLLDSGDSWADFSLVVEDVGESIIEWLGVVDVEVMLSPGGLNFAGVVFVSVSVWISVSDIIANSPSTIYDVLYSF